MKILRTFIIKKSCKLYSQKSPIVDVRLGYKYTSEVFLNLKGQGLKILEFFFCWTRQSQKIENVKKIANLWWYERNFVYAFSLWLLLLSFIFDSLDLNWIYSSKIKTKFSQVTSKVKSPFLFRRTKIIEIPLRIE